MPRDRLDALLSEAAAAEAARDRTRERMLRQAAEEEATFTGALVALAEARTPVAVQVRAGRLHRGVVSAVAREFVVVIDDRERPVIVTLPAITSVRVSGPAARTDVGAAEAPPVAASLRAILATLAPERPMVQVGIAGEEGLVLATLRSVGVDVVTLRPDGAESGRVVVPLAAVTEVVLLDRY